MATIIQSVINSTLQVTKKISQKFLLNVAFLLKTIERKNYTSIARSNNVKYDDVYIGDKEANAYIAYAKSSLIKIIKSLSNNKNKGVLLIDFTMIIKAFSTCIPKITYDYHGATKRVEKGLSAGFATWSNGKVNIPCNFAIWLRKRDAGSVYKKKSELVKELILELKKIIPFSEVRLDGAFASKEVIKFFTEHKIKFTIRIPRNRVIIANKESFQLRECPSLKLVRNEKFKTIYASYKGFNCYFTAEKRKSKKGKREVVYIISNLRRTPKEHVIAYKKRWPSEKFHRTAKQHLGLAHCQSTSIRKQFAHIFLVMYSYAILEIIKNDKKKKSPEEVLHPIRRQKLTQNLTRYLGLEETFMA
jgi:hypothetical protein